MRWHLLGVLGHDAESQDLLVHPPKIGRLNTVGPVTVAGIKEGIGEGSREAQGLPGTPKGRHRCPYEGQRCNLTQFSKCVIIIALSAARRCGIR